MHKLHHTPRKGTRMNQTTRPQHVPAVQAAAARDLADDVQRRCGLIADALDPGRAGTRGAQGRRAKVIAALDALSMAAHGVENALRGHSDD